MNNILVHPLNQLSFTQMNIEVKFGIKGAVSDSHFVKINVPHSDSQHR